MKRTLFFISIIVSLIILSPAQALFSRNHTDEGLSEEFKQIITLNESEKEFLATDFERLDYQQLYYYFVFVSEQENYYDQYLAWFEKLELTVNDELKKRLGDRDFFSLPAGDRKLFAETLLEVLHDTLFDRYFRTAYSSYWLIKSNTYNCVSSAIIYSVFCTKYNIKVVPVETDDHVFVKVDIAGTMFDVETTNKFGFNPGEKKEVLNQFGKLTGFNYVQPQQYDRRRDIDLKKLFLMVFYNSAALNQQHRKYLKAVQLAYIVKLGRNDPEGDTNFVSHFKNYTVFLMKQKKYEAAVALVNSYMADFGITKDFMDLRFDLLHNYVIIWANFNRIHEVKTFLNRENERYPEYADDQRFAELYYVFLCTVLNYYVIHHDYDDSLEVLTELNTRYPRDERNEEKVYSVLLRIHKYYDTREKKEFKKTEHYLTVFKRLLPEYHDVYAKINDYHYNELIDEDFRKNNYEAGIEKFFTYIKVYRNDSRLLAKIKDAYLELIMDHYEKKDFKAAIKYNEVALEKFENDSVLTNNLKVLFKKYIEEDLFTTRNYSRSRSTLNKALYYFPDDSIFHDYDKKLQKIRY